jgi:hypothetical protein
MAQGSMSWNAYAAAMGRPGAPNPVTTGWQPQGNPAPPGWGQAQQQPQQANPYGPPRVRNPNPAYFGPQWGRRRNTRRANRKNRRANRKNRKNTMRRRR